MSEEHNFIKTIRKISPEHADNILKEVELGVFSLGNISDESDLPTNITYLGSWAQTRHKSKYWENFKSHLINNIYINNKICMHIGRKLDTYAKNLARKFLFKNPIKINKDLPIKLESILEDFLIPEDQENNEYWKTQLQILNEDTSLKGLSLRETEIVSLLHKLDYQLANDATKYFKSYPLSEQENDDSLKKILLYSIVWDNTTLGSSFWQERTARVLETEVINDRKVEYLKRINNLMPEVTESLENLVGDRYIEHVRHLNPDAQNFTQLLIALLKTKELTLDEANHWDLISKKALLSMVDNKSTLFLHLKNLCSDTEEYNHVYNKLEERSIVDLEFLLQESEDFGVLSSIRVLDSLKIILRGSQDPVVQKIVRKITTYKSSDKAREIIANTKEIFGVLYTHNTTFENFDINTNYIQLTDVDDKKYKQIGYCLATPEKNTTRVLSTSESGFVTRIGSENKYNMNIGTNLHQYCKKLYTPFINKIFKDIKELSEISEETLDILVREKRIENNSRYLSEIFIQEEEKLNNEIKVNEAELQTYASKLSTLTKENNRLKSLIRANTSYSDKEISKVVKAIEDIKNIPVVKDVYVEENKYLTIQTTELTFTPPEDVYDWYEDLSEEDQERCEDYDLQATRSIGEFRIQIDLIGIDITMLSSTPVAGYWDESQHPHIDGLGVPCWGSAIEPVTQLATDKEYVYLVEYLLNFLSTINLEDSAGALFYRWPEFEEEVFDVALDNIVTEEEATDPAI